MRRQFTPGATRQIRVELALEAVATAESLEITPEEVEEEYAKLAKDYRMELDQVKDAVNEEDLKHDLLTQKARQIVFDSAVVGEPEEKPEEAETPAEETPAEEKKPRRKRAAKKEEGSAEEENPEV